MNNKSKQLTMNYMLNVLDGICPAYGRILFMTANDESNILAHNALRRPGRIDCKILLTYCDYYQITSFINLFYSISNSQDRLPGIKYNNITPAHLQSMLQTHSCDELINILKSDLDTILMVNDHVVYCPSSGVYQLGVVVDAPPSLPGVQ